LVSANQQSSDFKPVSKGANITADYKQLRFISSEKAREWMRATVDGLMIILCIVERVHLSFIKRVNGDAGDRTLYLSHAKQRSTI